MMEEMKKEMAEQKNSPSDDAVQDSFVVMMDEWNKEAMEQANNLKQAYDDTLKDIGYNAFNFGEKRSSKNGHAIIAEKKQDGFLVGNIAFFGIWAEFLVSWGKARDAVRKRLAEQKKQEELEKLKQELKAEFERRQKRNNLEKGHHGKRTFIQEVVSSNLEMQMEEKLNEETGLGSLHGKSSDTEESTKRRQSKGGEQRRFLLTDMQRGVLSSAQFMPQIIQDLSQFGKLSVDEDELVLDSFKRSRTVHACQKVERRLGALWTQQEIVQCMNDMKCSPNDIQSQTEMMKFLNSMVQSVSKGGRFRKHRKHGKAAHRWVLIDEDRLYWKENAAAANQKERSFNLAKIVAIQEGKETSGFKNASDVDDACCFSIVSKKNVTLDLSGENEDMVRKWIVYLKAYNRHFKQQMNEAARNPLNQHDPPKNNNSEQ